MSIIKPRNGTNAASDGSVINNGDGNENHIHNGDIFVFKDTTSKIASVSRIYEVCKIISNMDVEDVDYSLKTNSGWNDKIKYNDIISYNEIFKDQYFTYDKVVEALKQITRRDKIITNISSIYKKTKDKYVNSDDILNSVFIELSEVVIKSGESCGEELYEEDKNEAIHAIMFYAFTKCQLLEPVPDTWSSIDE